MLAKFEVNLKNFHKNDFSLILEINNKRLKECGVNYFECISIYFK